MGGEENGSPIVKAPTTTTCNTLEQPVAALSPLCAQETKHATVGKRL